MKRLLLIAYYFPPQPKAGALRPLYLARHIGEFGWQPTVLTRETVGDPGVDCEVIATPEWGARHPSNDRAALAPRTERHPAEQFVRNAVKSVVHFPDNRVGWLPRAAARARRLMSERRFDAVISSAPPPSAHFAARAAVRAAGAAWIADYRDLWAGPPGPYFRHGSGPTRLAIEYAVERWLLSRADAITAPTQSHGAALRENFGRDDVTVIPNACDMSAWEGIDVAPPAEFRLCYTGKLYPNLRTPDLLFGAVAKLRAAGDPAGLAVRFDFYGEDPDMVRKSAIAYGIEEIVAIHGEVPRPIALRAQRSAAALVLLLNTAGDLDHIENANPGSKILEYAGARRPILALGHADNLVSSLMEESGLGVFASNERECMAALRALFAAYRAGRFEPALKSGWAPFSPRDLARGFAEVLNRVTEGQLARAGEKTSEV